MAPSTSTSVTKKRGHIEPFDERKAYASVYSAALNAHLPHDAAHAIASAAMTALKAHLRGMKSISTVALHHYLSESIPDKSVALLYRHHKDLC